MALKDTLLAASIGATMVAGTHADTPQSVASSTKPAQTRSMSKAELQEINFKKNYQYLYKNVDGAWFSFGDEEKMRQALYDIGSFSMGREVIAGLPENMEFGSTHFIQFSLYGGFDVIDDSLKMSTRALGKTTNMDTNGTFVSVKDVLFHELMHAYQKKQGIILVDQHPSVDEAMHSFKLSEAETAAWNKVLSMVFMPTFSPATEKAAPKAAHSFSSMALLPASVTPPFVATLLSRASKLSLFCAA